jgi:hypothetical protein
MASLLPKEMRNEVQAQRNYAEPLETSTKLEDTFTSIKVGVWNKSEATEHFIQGVQSSCCITGLGYVLRHIDQHRYTELSCYIPQSIQVSHELATCKHLLQPKPDPCIFLVSRLKQYMLWGASSQHCWTLLYWKWGSRSMAEKDT